MSATKTAFFCIFFDFFSLFLFTVLFVCKLHILGRAQIFCARAQWQSCARAQGKMVRSRSEQKKMRSLCARDLYFFTEVNYFNYL
jgi:hypothetical protein